MAAWGRNSVNAKRLISLDQPATANVVLQELFELLEDYAPAWYTEEHHQRAAAALSDLVPQAAAS